MLFGFLKPKKEKSTASTSTMFYTPNLSVITDDMRRTAILHYCKCKKGKPIVPNGDYPRYMKYEYGIEKPWQLQSKMVADGFLFLDYKECCHPTDAGEQLLNQYSWLFSISRYNIHKEEYIEAMNKAPADMKSNDIIWGILQKHLLESAGKYGLIRNSYLDMYKLLKDENRNSDAIKHLLFVLWIDVSGYGNSGIDSKNILVAPAIPKFIVELKEYYDPKMLDDIEDLTPSSLTSLDTYKEILNRILNGKDFSDLVPTIKAPS